MNITFDNNQATVTTSSTRTFTIIDKGTAQLGTMKNDEGERVRIGWAVDYEDATNTITVYRAGEWDSLGYKPRKAMPPISDANKHQIAEEVIEQLQHGPWKGRFYFWAEPVADYLAEVKANVEHPEWCDLDSCWINQHDVTHRSKERTVSWTLGKNSVQRVRSYRALYTEHLRPGCECDDEYIDVHIDTDVADDIGASPADLRRIGEFLIAEADRASA